MDEGSSGRNGDGAAELVTAVRSSRVLWAAVAIPLSLLALMAAASLGSDWQGKAEGSTLGLFLLFLLVSLSEVVVLPAFLVSRAARDYLDPERGGDAERFANIYAMGVLGGTTPCVLGLVIFFYSGNLPQGLALFAVGLATVAYYCLRAEEVVSRALARGGSGFLDRLAGRIGNGGEGGDGEP
jgi:hypothetical protein